MQFDRDLTTLIRTSTGGPPTTVTWRKDGVLVDDSRYMQSHRLLNAEPAIDDIVLFDDDIASFVGSFTCNVRGRTEETTELNGKYLVASEIVMIIGCL